MALNTETIKKSCILNFSIQVHQIAGPDGQPMAKHTTQAESTAWNINSSRWTRAEVLADSKSYR